MQLHDVYLLSPEIALVGLACLLVMLDLLVSRKGWLTLLSAIGLMAPLVLTFVLWADPSGMVADDPTGPFGTLLVDKYALFFKVLVLVALELVVLTSADYRRKLGQFQGEYYSLLMFAGSGMMLLASTTEMVSIYIALELATLPLVALAAFMGHSPVR